MWDESKDTADASSLPGSTRIVINRTDATEDDIPAAHDNLSPSVQGSDMAINIPETPHPVCIDNPPRIDTAYSSRGRLKHRTDHRSQTRSSPYIKTRPSALLISRFLEAVSHNNTEKVKEMIRDGMSPNTYESYFNRSALHTACSRGFRAIVQVLLENGANPNIRDKNQNTPLHLAASTDCVDVVQLLLDYGTNVLLRDSNGLLALDFAIGKLRLSERIISKMQKLTQSDIHKHREKTADVCERIFAVFKQQLRNFDLPHGFDPETLEQMLSEFSEHLARVRTKQIDFDAIVDQINNLQVKSEIDSDVNSLLSTLQQFTLES